MSQFLLRLAFSVVGLGIAFAQADVAYNNFGLGIPFNSLLSYEISGPNSPDGDQSRAFQFTSATSGELVSISFAASTLLSPGTLHIGLYADSGDFVGTALASLSIPISSGSPTIYTATSPPGVWLSAGQHYWVGQTADDDASLAWYLASTGKKGRASYQFNSITPHYSTMTSFGAFRVETQAVPEPGTFAALGLGALGLTRRRKPHR